MRVRASGSLRRCFVDPRALEGGHRQLREDGAALVARLHAHRFRSIDKAGGALSSIGWCRGDGVVPRAFVAEDLWLAKVLAIPFRLDRKRLPAGALRVRRMEAEAAERREVGDRVAPGRRREIREKLEAELLERMVPATALHALLWLPEWGELLVDATSDAVWTALRSLMHDTFGVAPEPVTTATLATRLGGGKPASDLEPARWLGAAPERDDSLAFLGGEFLLWLWHGCETDGGRHELAGHGEVGVAFDQILELGAGDGARVIVRGDAPTRAPEAASALLSGRLPRRARLVLACGARSFEVTLTADRFDLESVRVQAEAEEITDENLRAGDEQRARWLFELAAIVDALFARFLELRRARDFESTTVPQLRAWITDRTRARSRAASA